MAILDQSIIDAHVHVWEPPSSSYPLAHGYSSTAIIPPSFSPQLLFEHAHPCGVNRIVLIQMSFYGFDNSYMLSAMAKYPGAFAGIAVIDEEAYHPEEEMKTEGNRKENQYTREISILSI